MVQAGRLHHKSLNKLLVRPRLFTGGRIDGEREPTMSEPVDDTTALLQALAGEQMGGVSPAAERWLSRLRLAGVPELQAGDLGRVEEGRRPRDHDPWNGLWAVPGPERGLGADGGRALPAARRRGLVGSQDRGPRAGGCDGRQRASRAAAWDRHRRRQSRSSRTRLGRPSLSRNREAGRQHDVAQCVGGHDVGPAGHRRA